MDSHLRGEHGDVVELAAAALLDRHGEEESVAVPGEDRFLVLHRGRGWGVASVIRSDKHPCPIPISEREGGARREGTNPVFMWACTVFDPVGRGRRRDGGMIVQCVSWFC